MSTQKIILFLLISSLFFGCTPKTMDKTTFTDEFAKAAKASIPDARMTVEGDLTVKILLADKTELDAFLDNAYQEYLQAPESRDEIIARRVASLSEQHAHDGKIDRTRIVPVVKDHLWLHEIQQSLKQRGAKDPPEYIVEALNDDLDVVYAEDGEKGIHYFTQASFDKSNIERKQLRLLAIENLKKILPPIEIHRGPIVSMITAGGTYEASVLLLDDVWRDVKVEGDIVVSVPARDVLLVAGSRTPGGVEKLHELTAKAMQEGAYHLTDTLFVRRGNRFEKFKK